MADIKERLKKYGFSSPDEMELAPDNWSNTNFPKSVMNRRLVFEKYGLSIEEPYFWIVNFLRDDFGMYDFEKITDIFSGSLFSGFGSQQATKVGVVQDRASNFLATVGKMSKEIFQIIRELKIIDEKLDHYYRSIGKDKKTDLVDAKKKEEGSEIVLKGYWVDLVDGGAKSPTSVYGMASQLGYGPLPDLFFRIHPQKSEDIDKTIKEQAGQFNDQVKMVLSRKLQSYLLWKQHTQEELETRRRFTTKYLKQHYQVIQMYLDWAKPYLRQANMLKHRDSHLKNVDLVASFDTTLLEIEFFAKGQKKGRYTPVILMHFYYASQPQGKYNPQYNQTEIVHTGRLEMTWRAYSWTDADIYCYKKMRKDEDDELIGDVIGAMNEAMREYGEDFRTYIKEQGESFSDRPDEKRVNLLTEQINNLGKKYADAVKKLKDENKGKSAGEMIDLLENYYKKNSKDKYSGWASPLTDIVKGFKEVGKEMFSFKFTEDKKKDILDVCPRCNTENPKNPKTDERNQVCSECGHVFYQDKEKEFKDAGNKKDAEGGAKAVVSVSYDKFKKAHRMVTW